MNPPGFAYIPGQGHDRKAHLHFVLSEPTLFAQVACANFTTPYDPCDRTCVVESGEHRWVIRQTIVAYDRARLVDVDEFERRVRDGTYTPYEPGLSPELLVRIQKGALASPHTVKNVKEAILWTLDPDKDDT